MGGWSYFQYPPPPPPPPPSASGIVSGGGLSVVQSSPHRPPPVPLDRERSVVIIALYALVGIEYVKVGIMALSLMFICVYGKESGHAEILAELLAERHKLGPFVQVLPHCSRLLSQEIRRITGGLNQSFADHERFERDSPFRELAMLNGTLREESPSMSPSMSPSLSPFNSAGLKRAKTGR
ncbi:hypothetical protein ACFE04_000856 [Oxalis oulophora]